MIKQIQRVSANAEQRELDAKRDRVARDIETAAGRPLSQSEIADSFRRR